MKNAKLLMFAAVLVVLQIAISSADWDSAQPTKPAQDLRQYLLPVPIATQYTYGNSDRTQVLFNLIAIKDSCIKYEQRLTALETEIAELKKQIAGIRASQIPPVIEPKTVVEKGKQDLGATNTESNNSNNFADAEWLGLPVFDAECNLTNCPNRTHFDIRGTRMCQVARNNVVIGLHKNGVVVWKPTAPNTCPWGLELPQGRDPNLLIFIP